MKIAFRLLSPTAVPPQRMSEHSAGFDLCADIPAPLVLAPSQRAAVPTGIAIELPPDCEAQIRPRSGLAIKYGIGILNSPGTIDADYRGEIKAILINHSNEPFSIEPGMRICQMVIARYVMVELAAAEVLSSSDRADGGFGSTGH